MLEVGQLCSREPPQALCSREPPQDRQGGRAVHGWCVSAGWYRLKKASVGFSGTLKNVAGLIHGVLLKSTVVGIFTPQGSTNARNQFYFFPEKQDSLLCLNFVVRGTLTAMPLTAPLLVEAAEMPGLFFSEVGLTQLRKRPISPSIQTFYVF